jgi:hypothetical protein
MYMLFVKVIADYMIIIFPINAKIAIIEKRDTLLFSSSLFWHTSLNQMKMSLELRPFVHNIYWYM